MASIFEQSRLCVLKSIPLLFSLSGSFALSLSCAIAAVEYDFERASIATHRTYFVSLNGSDNWPGSADRPWATINHASAKAVAGDTVIVHGGRYVLPTQVRVRNSGRADAWITFIGYPGEEPILDAQSIRLPAFVKGALNNGAFQIEGASHIRVANLSVINSHDAGITVRDSSDIELINNSTDGSYSSGIAVWNTNHDDKGTKRIRVIGNTIIKATTWDLAAPDVPRRGEPPHEALSIGGAVDFEVAYNHVYDSDKEGIDVKETSSRGKVHHNHVHNLHRQGIYVDAWFGKIDDIKVFANVVHDCGGAGVALSAENGTSIEDVDIYNNLIFNNNGSGLYFSRWGANNTRRRIQIFNNVFYHNGYGPPSNGQAYYWQTGGIYLYSASVYDVSISHNIMSENNGFQIGYSELFLKDGPSSWQEAAREQKIVITRNLIYGSNPIASPIESGGQPFDRVKIHSTTGDRAIFGDPSFRDAAEQDFGLRNDSPATKAHIFAGAYPPSFLSQKWWTKDFPPKLVRYPRTNEKNRSWK